METRGDPLTNPRCHAVMWLDRREPATRAAKSPPISPWLVLPCNSSFEPVRRRRVDGFSRSYRWLLLP